MFCACQKNSHGFFVAFRFRLAWLFRRYKTCFTSCRRQRPPETPRVPDGQKALKTHWGSTLRMRNMSKIPIGSNGLVYWMVDFYGECRYIMPYMDPMGSMFSVRPWSKVTFGCKLGADKHCLLNFPYWKEPDGPGDWSCDRRWSICRLVTQPSQTGHQQPNHGKKGNVDYVFFWTSHFVSAGCLLRKSSGRWTN